MIVHRWSTVYLAQMSVLRNHKEQNSGKPCSSLSAAETGNKQPNSKRETA